MITASIIGASGYSGFEILRLLAARNDVVLKKAMASTSAGTRIDEFYPALTGLVNGVFEPTDPEQLAENDVVFAALPSGEAMKVVPSLLQKGPRVIDLSGDFRLPVRSLYEEYYPHRHIAEPLCREAVYGLPELNRDSIAEARLVANPGCYATSIILGLLPLLSANVIASTQISICSMSGVSGAGRTSTVDMSFAEINDNIRAYKILKHQHIPEIEWVLGRAAHQAVTVSFVPHLVPLTRGIYTSITGRLEADITDADVADLFLSFYRSSPFVRYRRHIPQIRDVVYTNYCDITCMVDRRTGSVIVLSVLDNLVKGAAGQAIQNMNLMFGLPEHLGLLQKGVTEQCTNA